MGTVTLYELYYTDNFSAVCNKGDTTLIAGESFDDVMSKHFDGYVYREVTKDDFYDVVLKSGKEVRYYRFRFG